jgi:hypothetical protein
LKRTLKFSCIPFSQSRPQNDLPLKPLTKELPRPWLSVYQKRDFNKKVDSGSSPDRQTREDFRFQAKLDMTFLNILGFLS